MRVKVQAAAISAGTKLTTQQYVATNPEDTFSIFKVYSGVTSGLSGIVYVQLPESTASRSQKRCRTAQPSANCVHS